MLYKCIIKYLILKPYVSTSIYTVTTRISTTNTATRYYPSAARDVFPPPFMMILCQKSDYQSHLHIILWFKRMQWQNKCRRIYHSGKKIRDKKKICHQYYGSDSNRELYIKGAGSHLLELNNSCDTRDLGKQYSGFEDA